MAVKYFDTAGIDTSNIKLMWTKNKLIVEVGKTGNFYIY